MRVVPASRGKAGRNAKEESFEKPQVFLKSSVAGRKSMQVKTFYEFGPFRLASSPPVLLRDGNPLALTPKALELLVVLVRNSGNLVSKEELMKAAWPDTFVEEGNLTQNISLLRKALGADLEDRPYIETMSKRGYRFAASVRLVEAGSAAIAGVPARAMQRRRRTALAISVLLLIAGGTLVYRRVAPRSSPVQWIAVLPLENLSGDPAQDYLADGLTEALTGELAKIGSLRVISRTSAMRYKGARKPAPQIARELKVDSLVEGSAERFGDRVVVRVQLIRGSTDEHLWSESYDRHVRDVLLLQSEIALAIARQIRAGIQPEREARLSGRPVNRDAFEAYLRGRHAWNKRTPEAIKAAIAHFQAAIDADPVYAPAYAGLADCYNQLGTVIIGERSPSETRPLAVAAARKALEIDNQLAEAHAALAYADLYNWNWEQAEQGFKKAIELNPSYASAHLWFSHYLVARRRFNEALQEVNAARDLDPLSPIIATQVGWMFHHMGRLDEAIAQYRKVLQDNPDYVWALWQLGGAYMLESRYAEAVEALEKALAPSGRNPVILGTLAEVYGRAGQRSKAEEFLAELNHLARRRYVSPTIFVFAYRGMGDDARAFEFLEKSYQERSNSLVYFGVSPGYEEIRSTPRGQQMLHRLGLAP